MALAHRNATRIFAIVLAAGASRRFGSSKQLASFDGDSLVRRAARLARQVCGDDSVLVVGHRADEIAAAAHGECRFLLVNDRYADGIGTSIALAVRALEHVADALLVLLADQPLITIADLEALLSAWPGEEDVIVASRFDGALGPPALLPRRSFGALRAQRGDSGARGLFDSGRFRVREVDCQAAATDVDTPADLERLRQPAD